MAEAFHARGLFEQWRLRVVGGVGLTGLEENLDRPEPWEGSTFSLLGEAKTRPLAGAKPSSPQSVQIKILTHWDVCAG